VRGLAALLVLVARGAAATTFVVAESGGDFTAIQPALDAAMPGDTVRVHEKATPYVEKLVLPRSGAPGAYITLEAWPGEHPVVDGTGVPGDHLVQIASRSWVRVTGLELRNDLGVTDGSGIRVTGSGSHVELRQNRIHDIRGRNAMGITVYATEPTAISDLIIDGNEIFECEPAPSEALTLNGNVDGFQVTNNVVRDVNNIGIDMIGGERDIQPDQSLVARNGVVRGNQVMRARSSYGGGFAGGIYVDGGSAIVVENNLVTESDLGLEVGAENPGIVASAVIVRNNLLVANDKAGLVFGGYAARVGRVRDSRFTGNTCYHNDTLGAGFGELWIQYAEQNIVENNLFSATPQNLLLQSDAGNTGNTIDYNVWFVDAGAAAARFVWNGTEYAGFAAYRAGTGQDAHSLFADPALADAAAGDFHLTGSSPAIDAGDPAFVADPGETDLDGGARVLGPRVDMGADEASRCGNGVVELPEQCDDGNVVSGDGCDANCTPTGCGNRIVTAGEQCDDGNLVSGDCCSPICQLEPPGAPCDDGDACTQADACTAGVCAGLDEPATGCRSAASGTLSLRGGALVEPSKRLLTWRWSNGAGSSLADFGDPVATTGAYTLCLYDATTGGSRRVLRATVPGGGSCAGKPCWKARGVSGFTYRDRELARDGVASMTFKVSGGGQASIALKAKGPLLETPALPLAQSPDVTIQLRGGDACWETVFPAPAARGDGSRFKDTAR
jgi:cysteine-rich repeat protein